MELFIASYHLSDDVAPRDETDHAFPNAVGVYTSENLAKAAVLHEVSTREQEDENGDVFFFDLGELALVPEVWDREGNPVRYYTLYNQHDPVGSVVTRRHVLDA